MAKNKFDIFKTFEIFNMSALSVLKEKFLEIVMIETDNIFSNSNPFAVSFKKDDTVQLTVVNDKKTFDLLSNTWQKHKKKIESNLKHL